MKLEVKNTKEIIGKVIISGSKNATLPLMACSILTNEQIILENVPNISDIRNMQELLIKIGVKVTYNQIEKKMYLKRETIIPNLNFKEMGKIRASYYLMGALIANGCNFEAYYPGGCNFSKRPIDFHLEAFRKMGYQISEKDNYLHFKKKSIDLDKMIFIVPKKSVGTTINIILACSKSPITTIIKNASLEPEVLQVIKMLRKMKVFIKIRKKEIIIDNRIYFQDLKGTTFKVMADRIEAGSYLLLGIAVNQTKVTLENVEPKYLKEVLKVTKKMGGEIKKTFNKITLVSRKKLNPINLNVDTYPSFPTDLQPILSVACLKANGTSIIKDLVYPNRITHLEEIKKAEGIVKTDDASIVIKKSSTIGSNFNAHDLRCGFACIILGLISDGISTIDDAQYIFRGYEELIEKMENIGVIIKKVV